MSVPPRNPVPAPPPRRPGRGRWGAWPIVVLWAGLMTPLLRWGLPSRARDHLLFGGEPAWSAERFGAAAAAGARQERAAGADTDLNPLAARDRIILLTPDEPARAEILRRYRLFSRQPDEMITFMALQRMRPRQGDFDPRLYQYGGAYIYLIGAALAGTALVGLTRVTSDIGVYLAQPELFAVFYLVARTVTLLFGGLLLVGVWRLGRRAAGRTAGWLALLLVACAPVFLTGVLEAKPHVPAACLLVWATHSAVDYWRRPERRAALRMGAQVGLASGLVLTGLAGAVLWPALLAAGWRRAAPWERRRRLGQLLLAGGLGAAVALLTNFYVPYNFLFNRAALASNLENSTAMYAEQARQAAAGAVRVGVLLVESGGAGVLLAGMAGLLLLVRRWPGGALVAASPGLALLVLATVLGAGKPAEFARFLLLPVVLLCVAAAGLLGWLSHRTRLGSLVAAVVVLTLMRTPAYLTSFSADARGTAESRRLAAEFLASHMAPLDAVAVLQEPAPYAVPPIDFAHRTVYWLPATPPAEPDVAALPPWLVFTADDAEVHRAAWWTRYYDLAARFPPAGTALSRIAWANKPVFIYERNGGRQ